ncbi:murein hydrolase activator EnvC family protein [Aquisalimonas asiatica]|uniref:Septal ring factor EnvC, activator of murein hydrolases AmiA and AmiB n=1 Tax=Aquisalimonas asiatica TaxID=406100 RepID=A0A1H8UD18_9GAMM|nr:peptidoglycan DD-metalloendopeptidase family protein [Aquisalimonas asiatica]SEP00996.1 Septal ring factor EnvC, activator of murein hydrolases AmiA and AmiB [Aquisalimonas asiatica]
MPIPRSQRIVLPAVLAAVIGSVAADDYQQRAEELEALRERIAAIEAGLAEREEQRDAVVGDLRALEQAIGRAVRRLDDLDEQLAEREARVDELRDAVEAERQAVADHRDVLREEIRDAYASGRQEYLKLLLNQEDPAALDRMLIYFDYIGRARSERIRTAMAAMADYRDMRAELQTEVDRLEAVRHEQEAERQELAQQRQDREAVLEQVEAAIGDDQDRLERLAEDEEELQALVDDLQDALTDITDEDLDRTPFQDQRGALPWPTGGSLAARYGDRRNGGGEWSGLLVRADRGTRVEAVSHGRIVFADWLRGLGLLLIIDHGDGYMTLYGYNESLYKDVGDWVDAGDVVARVGDTGGRDNAGLYFELRVQGQPEDPLQWLEGNSP